MIQMKILKHTFKELLDEVCKFSNGLKIGVKKG